MSLRRSIVFCGLLVVWAFLDHQQALVWRTNRTLFEHATEMAPNKARVTLNYGRVFDMEGQNAEADWWYQLAWNQARTIPKAEREAIEEIVLSNRGHLALERRDIPSALILLARVRFTSPEFMPGRFNYAIALTLDHQCGPAAIEWESLKIPPMECNP